MHKLIYLSIFISMAFTAQSQDWVNLKSHGASFYEVQEAFEAEWNNKEYEKGKGYKQFKRWEHFMEPRVDEEGFLPPSIHIWNEYKKLNERKISNPDKNGDWSFNGPYDINSNGNGEGIGRVNVIAVDPTDANTIFVGVPGGGLWKSTDNGNSWTPKTDHLPTVGVSGIAIDFNNPNIVYIGTGDGDASDTYSIGVLQSTAGGDTWSMTGVVHQAENQRNVRKLLMHPTDPNILFAATNVGLFKTINGGDNWSGVSAGDIDDVEFHPTNPEIVYLCRPTFYKSTDGGDSFNSINSGLPSGAAMSRSCIAVSPDEPNWVYLLAGGNDYGLLGVYRSTDGGEDFSERANQNPNLLGWSDNGGDSGGQAWYDLALAIDPNDANKIFVGGVNIWGSNNGGSTWNLKAHWITGFSGYVHADIHFLNYFNGNLYCGSDGGIFRSSNHGSNWTNKSAGLGITQIYGIGTTDADPGKITLGAQDNGTSLKTGAVWNKVFGGDGMQTQISATNSSRVYCATQNGNIYLSNNGGNNYDNISWGIDETGGWLTPYELKTSNNNVVIAGYENIWEYDGGWNQLSDGSFATIDHIALSASDDQYIYFATGSSLHMTSNYGGEWNNITTGLATGNLSISGVELDPNDPNIVYVTYSGYNEAHKIYRSFDAGVTWENYTGSLPNVPANCLGLDAEGGVYVGTDLGVFYKDANLSSWQHFSDNLPLVPVSDIDILSNNNIVRVATYGRGIWDSPLYTPIAAAPEVDFESSDQVICEGQAITFTDFSFNAHPTWNWTFEGGTPSTSTLENPEVIYEVSGTYPVTLTMSNDFGEVSETKVEFINVLNGLTQTIPFQEGFEEYTEFPADQWFVKNENNNVTWDYDGTTGYESESSISLNNNMGNIGDYDELISYSFDLTGGQETVLNYKFAHAQRTEDNHGKLRIYFSKNCGENWQSQGSNTAGGSLSTADPTTEYFIPTADQWDEDSEDIGEQYWGPDFQFKFQHKNDGGNVLYLDDINIDGFVGFGELFQNRNGINIYPNPTRDVLTIRFNQDGKTNLRIINLLGAVVMTKSLTTTYGEQEIRLDVIDLSNGLYHLEMRSESGVETEKFVIDK